jgi:acetoin utilization deacetylase AcuC-like enzyme
LRFPPPHPDLIVFLAGADPWEGDRLGPLALTKEGLRARDTLVLDRAEALGVPICTTLAGGYAPDVRDTVEINLATARAVADRHSATQRAHASGTGSHLPEWGHPPCRHYLAL